MGVRDACGHTHWERGSGKVGTRGAASSKRGPNTTGVSTAIAIPFFGGDPYGATNPANGVPK
eukprot:2667387-Pyramimonas_sp.AAC.1